MNNNILPFAEISINDVGIVGGKNASLGEMYANLSGKGVAVPDGFAVTAQAFDQFLTANSLQQPLHQLMQQLERPSFKNLTSIGAAARKLILEAKLPDDLIQSITDAYHHLDKNNASAVAVRSSATAEDLPQASFAGQHESYLNINGVQNVLKAVQQCFASLYTDRAIKYREDNCFAHEKVALSVGVQKMVRSDLACSGVAFTLEPESGFSDVISISGVWGLGENIVQGAVNPDEYLIFKPTLRNKQKALIQKKLGEKALTMIYKEAAAPNDPISTVNIETPEEKRILFTLCEEEIYLLANWCLIIEEHYGKPMDIEWAKDGVSGALFIVQARPETVHSNQDPHRVTEYKLLKKGRAIVEGNAVGEKIATGIARVILSPADADKINAGEILVTSITSPDWDPVLKRTAAIITDKGGRTSHASIVARELGVPALVGCGNATSAIKDGDVITVCCSEGKTGYVYEGALPFTTNDIDLAGITKPATTEAMMILGDPDQAFKLSFYPNDGIGLMRMEFIITHAIRVHPMALVRYDQLQDEEVRKKLAKLTVGYNDKKEYFVDRLSQGIATIAAAFYPKDVIVRTSDFKTNEYANLMGGSAFEPKEENPMLGFRGASRYYSEYYREGFELECAAIKRVREEMGLTNVKVMIPFCRTLDEAKQVIATMRAYGLNRNADNTLEIYMMVEIPSNVLLAEEFATLFDGFSIGSNDLTQLVLGVDRDSAIISHIFNEQDPAVKQMIAGVIQKAKNAGIKIGLCGQAPSDIPAFAQFLVEEGISSISFNPDALLKGIENIKMAEDQLLVKS